MYAHYEAFKDSGKDIRPFTPYHKIDDRAFWDTLDSAVRDQIIKKAEQHKEDTYPALPASLYMDFNRTGNRVHFEDAYFKRRHLLNLFVLAECIEHQGRFIDYIINGIWAICEESAWQLPSHNTYVRDGENIPLPDTSQPVLDLFSCETAALLATVYYMMSEELEKVSPFLPKRISMEVKKRVITPYQNSHFWWMGNGTDHLCNWTVWCTQNVLLSYFLLTPSWHKKINQKTAHAILEKACQSTQYFLDSYGEDGCCDEGVEYYRQAALCLLNILEICNEVTDYHFPIYDNDKIRNMASYVLSVHVDDIYYVNYADCSPVPGRAGAREFLFGMRSNLPALCSFAAREFRSNEDRISFQEINLFYQLQTLTYYADIMEYPTDIPNPFQNMYYESVGLFTSRGKSLFLGMKAGSNNDSHNHNDTGSFTVYKDGKPFFIDVGIESYSADTFSDKRYNLWSVQSAYHNLPTVNGYMEAAGDFGAKDVQVSFTDKIHSISMDLKNAFPEEAGIASYFREAALIDEKEIIITDILSLKKDFKVSEQVETHNSLLDKAQGQKNLSEKLLPDFLRTRDSVFLGAYGAFTDCTFVLSLMTYEKPIPALDTSGKAEADTTNENVRLLQIGKLGTLELEGNAAVIIEELPITNERLQKAWKHSIYRILLFPEQREIKLHIR